MKNLKTRKIKMNREDAILILEAADSQMAWILEHHQNLDLGCCYFGAKIVRDDLKELLEWIKSLGE